MGNQSSSTSSTSSKSTRRRQRLEKSASCASDFATKSASSLEDVDVCSRLSQSGVYHQEQQVQPPTPTITPTPLLTTTQTAADQTNNCFHYNIHSPSDLLNPHKPRANSSAMEFVSTKSPLRDYLKEKFSRNASSKITKVEINTPTISQTPKNLSNIDKFAMLLTQLSLPETQKLERISENVFMKHLLPHSPILSNYLWKFLTRPQNKNINAISESILVTTGEKIFLLHTDKDQLTFYLKMFASDQDMVEIESFMDFLIAAYQLATVGEREHFQAIEMKQYNPFQGKAFLEAVVKSCYHIKEEMSVCFLVNWLVVNLPRLHHLLHKYFIHQLTTGYTQLITGNATIHTQSGGVTSVATLNAYLHPNLEKTSSSDAGIADDAITLEDKKVKLDPILIWLFRSSLPPKFLVVFARKPENMQGPHSPHLNSAQLLLQLIHSQNQHPSWDQLYDSETDGLSINRFQFHVFNYRGPTLLLVIADNGYSFAIASDTEWKESCHFWGNEEATLIQLQPEFRIVEKGNKLIYVNFSIRGYPFGIQVGKDPKNVSLDIKPDFSYAHYKKIPCRIINISVWGCAPKQTQSAQTEHKKWEAKQCENVRKVNINSAEWKDNPDKYLLELAGNYRSYDT